MADHEIPPEFLDYILAVAGRADGGGPRPHQALEPPPFWLFQANPTIYNIDLALTEVDELAWAVRQHTGRRPCARPGLPLAVGNDAGIVATATCSPTRPRPPGPPTTRTS